MSATDAVSGKPIRKMSREELLQLLYAQELELGELREAMARAEDRALYAREFWEAARTEAYQCIEKAWAIQRQAEVEARRLIQEAQYQANALLWNIQQAQLGQATPVNPVKKRNEWWYESVESFGKDTQARHTDQTYIARD